MAPQGRGGEVGPLGGDICAETDGEEGANHVGNLEGKQQCKGPVAAWLGIFPGQGGC